MWLVHALSLGWLSNAFQFPAMGGTEPFVLALKLSLKLYLHQGGRGWDGGWKCQDCLSGVRRGNGGGRQLDVALICDDAVKFALVELFLSSEVLWM